MNYLPEWKVYLWKKLLLSIEDKQTNLTIANFLYFDEEEQREIMHRQAQGSIDTINKAYTTAIFAKKELDISSSSPTLVSESYYRSKPKEVMEALLELSESGVLDISNIVLNKEYIDAYKKGRTEYLAIQRRKYLASRGFKSESSKILADERLTHPFCSLTEDVFNRVSKGEPLSEEDLKQTVISSDSFPIWKYLKFDIKIHKTTLTEKLENYIELFLLGELVTPPKVRYFSYKEQQARLNLSLKNVSQKYGSKNIPITFEELAKEGGWYQKDEKHFRFYETILSMEKMGDISIKELRGEEVVVSLINLLPSSKPESAVKILTSKDFDLNIEREQEFVKSIVALEDHVIRRDKWLATKKILGKIYEQLPAVGNEEYLVKIEKERLPPEQQKMLGDVLTHAYKAGILSSTPRHNTGPSKPVAVISSEMFRNFLSGDHVIVSNRNKFEEYYQLVSKLSVFIEEDGKSKFPGMYNLTDIPPKVNSADQKRIYILEKLKTEWDLTSISRRKINISNREWNQWRDEAGLTFDQLQSVLSQFQAEGIVRFDFLSEWQ